MTESQDPATPTKDKLQRPIRWWPAVVILMLASAAWIWVRLANQISHQQKNIETAQVVVYTLLALLLWVLLFSRLRWKLRLSVFGGVVGLVLLTGALFKIRGVTGDLVPILEWRWKQSLSVSVPGAQPMKPGLNFQPEGPSMLQSAHDYPQFLGPDRDGKVKGPLLVRDWKAHPPKLLWRQPIGAAWSGFAVAGDYAVTQEQRGSNECVVCYELKSGRTVWSHSDETRYFTTLAGEGPRATPTIVSNRVYSLGATGILTCLELASGKQIWSKDIILDNQSHTNGWGMSGSPLVMGGYVVVSPGGKNGRSLVAYDRDTGAFVWGGGNDEASYSSPFLTMLAGERQVLIFNSHALASHAPDTGKVLWEYPWPSSHPHITVPVVLPENRVLLSSGYGTGSEVIQIKKDAEGNWSAGKIWKSIRLKAKFANLIYLNGYIYGLDDGILACLDAADGSLKWKEGRYGHGQVILTGGLLLLMAENGDVVLLEPIPQEHRELTRFSALRGKTWNPPALAGEHLLVRNDKEAACYRLPVVGNER